MKTYVVCSFPRHFYFYLGVCLDGDRDVCDVFVGAHGRDSSLQSAARRTWPGSAICLCGGLQNRKQCDLILKIRQTTTMDISIVFEKMLDMH